MLSNKTIYDAQPHPGAPLNLLIRTKDTPIIHEIPRDLGALCQDLG